MRTTIASVTGALLLMCSPVFTTALGAEPANASTSAPATASTAATTSAPATASAPAAADTANSASTPAATAPVDGKPATTPASSDPNLGDKDDAKEKMMRRMGYTVKQKNGEKMYCKVQEVLGSRLNTKSVCMTYDEAMALRNDAQDNMRQKGNRSLHGE